MEFDLIAHTDGACAGNPGPMGIGVALYDGQSGELIDKHSSLIGFGTNNIAEYTAVITALEMICAHPEAHSAVIRSDSQLIVNQINGKYAVNNHDMKDMIKQVQSVTGCLPYVVVFEWISRTLNPVADALASGAISMPQAAEDETGIILWSDDMLGQPNPVKLAQLPVVKCHAEIEELNHAETEAKFASFIGLKPNGTDGYGKRSRIFLLEAIETRFGLRASNWLDKALKDADEEFSLNAMRWAARGLRPDYALKKAAVDVEMESNRKTRHTKH